MDHILVDPEEREWLLSLVHSVTGNDYIVTKKKDLLFNNVKRRIMLLGLEDLEDYAEVLEEDEDEWNWFISSVTIHTTSWFREKPHFVILKEFLDKRIEHFKSNKFTMLCAACSTGEEVYSFAIVLQEYKDTHPDFEYSITGIDIDPISIGKAKKAIYKGNNLPVLYNKYQKYVLHGKGNAKGFFTLDPAIRHRCHFFNANLLDFEHHNIPRSDWVVCRNALIYFTPEKVEVIIKNLLGVMNPTGRLCLGHSENFDNKKFKLENLGNNIYTPPYAEGEEFKEKKKVLIVDDSKVIRGRLEKIYLENYFEPILAESGPEASKIIQEENIDLITLDLNMPEINGDEWIKREREKGMKTPTILISDSTPNDAPQIIELLELHVQDYFDKAKLKTPELLISQSKAILGKKVISTKENEADRAKVNTRKKLKPFYPDLIMVGASTGGTSSLPYLLKNLPKPCPPVIIVQHITPNFSKAFAHRMANVSGLTLGEIKSSEKLEPDHLYMALGDYHVGVRDHVGTLKLQISQAPPQSSHRPSVDFMYQTAVSIKNKKMIAILLTGMGADGAKGMKALNSKGVHTFVQDEASSVVFGMPKEAIKLGAADFVGNLIKIRQQIDLYLGQHRYMKDKKTG